MLKREKLTSHLHQEEELFLAGQILDKVELVIKGKGIEKTHFLNPHQQKIAVGIISQIYEVNFLLEGGYKGAERKRVLIFPEYLFPDHIDSSVSILKLTGNFQFQPLSHRDFLGSLMGTGIKREMIGDILILEDFAQVVVARELKDFLLLNLTQVHQIPVKLEEIPAEEVVIPRERTKEINASVASLRLDAVSSAGFSDSRSKILREIKSEKVKLNWKVTTNPAQQVEPGDLISIQGRGRIKITSVNGKTHRGRVKLTIKKYI